MWKLQTDDVAKRSRQASFIGHEKALEYMYTKKAIGK